MRGRLVLIVTLLALPAHAAPEPLCDGCAISLPEREGPIPLLVVLHGDHEHATKWLARWRGPALDRGWGVLALQCPEDLGCANGVWYRWDGDPAWVSQQVERATANVAIDRDRMFLVAWSGGAAFVGLHARSWREFAGLVMHGGGVMPRDGRCASPSPPVYFLVGDGNRYHRSTKMFRRYLEKCGSDVTWDLLADTDHHGEDLALDGAKASTILDWLAGRDR